jgi:membrane-bound lytic murein transglycosylase F
MVARGEIPLTVSDSHILNVALTYRDEIVGALTLSRGGDDEKAIAFAVRPQNTELAAYLDGFVKKTYRGLEYNLARKAYFEDKHRIAVATTRRTGVSGELSPYDGVIKKYSESYGLDWRLMAAQAFHESGFDPNAKSWVGALGLFQVMPATGQEMGITELVDPPEGGVRAGIMYLDRQIKRMDPTIPFRQRVRFALAAYNVGYGHLVDARRLAAEIGLDPDRWFGNVENAIALLEDPQYHTKARYGYCRGTEPALYVSRIQNTYDNYVKIVQ